MKAQHAIPNMLLFKHTPYDRLVRDARERVREEEALAPHEDILIDYQWDNYFEHIGWVAIATTEEILNWVASVRAQESQEA